ncbi:MAG: hypothetical protein NVS3B20_25570 [Polyangiales bacterium]
MIALEYLRIGQTDREREFHRCLVETADNFVDQYPSMNATFGFFDARTDWDAFESWMDRADAARTEITKDLPWVATDTIGTSKLGSDTLGDKSWFAASYDYEASWSVHMDKVLDPTTGTHRICRSQGKATAKLVAEAWALKQDLKVVDAYLHVDAGTPGVGGAAGNSAVNVTAHLTLLDNPIYTDATTVNFDFAPDTRANKIEHKQTVFIGFVPVTLGAKVEFSAGFEAHAGGIAPQPADADCNFNDPAGVQIFGSITPYAKASASAYGALGGEFAGLGAEAGVEGRITLVNAKIPTNATVTFGGHTAFDSTTLIPSVHVKTDTSMDLDFLSGAVVAYAEVCYLIDCKRTEKPIFTWPGIHVHEAIWTLLDKDYPIPALQTALPPTPVPPTSK